jgi:hypothetical protein
MPIIELVFTDFSAVEMVRGHAGAMALQGACAAPHVKFPPAAARFSATTEGPRHKSWVSNLDQMSEQYGTETRFAPGYNECAARAPAD